MCSRPRKPQRKPKPKAAEFSGSKLIAESLICNFFERLAQLVDVLALDGVEAAEDDGLHLLVSRERLGGGGGGVRYSVSDVRLVYRLYARADEADLAGAEAVDLHHVRLEYAHLVELVRLARRHEADCLSRLEACR